MLLKPKCHTLDAFLRAEKKNLLEVPHLGYARSSNFKS